ncbi:MAG: glycosyltransferase family 4 protein [Bacteroidales bacterium]|jgi:glycosyltransferase involved in cell wall biosynthesis|nr:glycosyltransferase family 4 protein [Bacteroidales bacterium]
MKILQLCHKPPFPAVDGGCIAVNAITRGLVNSGKVVKVMAINTPKHPFHEEQIPEDYFELTNFESVFVNTNINPIKLFLSLFTSRSYHIERFVSKDFKQRLISLLKKEKFDIIQLESLYVAPYIASIRQYSKAKIVLRSHNIEHQIWNRFLKHELNFFKRIVLKNMVKSLKKYELSVTKQVDGFLAISEPDFAYFAKHCSPFKGTVIPMGMDMERYEYEEFYIPALMPSCCYIGSLNWIPNKEGVEWFLNDIWDEVAEQFPELTFTLAGRDFSEKLTAKNYHNVFFIGEVESANDFILSHDIMIVPLLSGSGVRIKILEGMALGKTIITTTIGAEGLDVDSGKNIFIADTAEEFIDVIEKCINTPEICKIIGENAREYIILRHNNEVITKKLISFYEELLAK